MKIVKGLPLTRRDLLTRFLPTIKHRPEVTNFPVMAASGLKRTLSGQSIAFDWANCLKWLANLLK